jgi:hypothetical protein
MLKALKGQSFKIIIISPKTMSNLLEREFGADKFWVKIVNILAIFLAKKIIYKFVTLAPGPFADLRQVPGTKLGARRPGQDAKDLSDRSHPGLLRRQHQHRGREPRRRQQQLHQAQPLQ